MPANISWRKMIKRFRLLGFEGPYKGGKHFFMIKDNLKIRVPNNHGSDISAGLICEILRQADIDKEDWEKLM